MAANNPNPFSGPGGDSQIFRRAPKPPTPPEEPTELLQFDDDDALGSLGREVPVGESPSVIVRRGYRDGSGVNLGGPKAPLADSGSSIFGAGDPVLPSAPGSGWFDSIPPQKRGGTDADDATQEIDELFSALEADSGSSVIPHWKEQQATNSVTESEVLRAFDNLSSRDVTKHLADSDAGIDYDDTQPSGSHIFPDTRSDAGDGDSADLNESGVDLLSPDWDSEMGAGPKSSIFGAASNQDASQIELDVLGATDTDDGSDHAMFSGPVPGDGGSSIFNKSTPMPALDGDIDFTAVVGDEESGRIDWATKPQSGAMQPSMDASFDDATLDPFATEMEATPPPKPKRTPAGMVGTSGAGAVIAPPKPRPVVAESDDDGDRPIRPKKSKVAPEPKRGGGMLGWVGGGLAGMVVGAGTMAGLYFADVLPSNGPAPKSVAQTPANTAELDALKAKEAVLILDLAAAKTDADNAASEVKAKNKELVDATAAVNLAKTKLEAGQADAVALKETLAAKSTALAKVEADAKQAKLDSAKAVADLKTSQAETESAKLIATKATDDLKKEAAVAETAVKKYEAAVKEAEAKTALANTYLLQAAAAAKKLEDADKALTGVVASLKANKLIDDKLDGPAALAGLPATFKKLAALNESPDAKKAAEALAAAKKETEAAKIALDAAEKDKVKAAQDAIASREKAKLQIESVVKKAQADVDAAKKDLETAKKDSDSKVIAAVAKAVADAEAKLTQAKLDQAALLKKQQSDSVVLQADFARQIAEARLGGTQITPAEVLQLEKATRDYGAGIAAFQSNDFTAARVALETAVKLQPADARYWYFLGLTLWELGQATAAKDAFTKGSDLENRNRPGAALVGESLERVQGSARKELNKYR